VKAVLVQRIFLRVGRKTMTYPAIGHALSGRLWCAKDVTLITTQTPDLQDPFADAIIPENTSGGAIYLNGQPGLAFWPRVNETDEGLVKFVLTIDGAKTETPLIFVDNVAATSTASLAELAHIFRKTNIWRNRRTLLMGDQNVRFADETKTGDCSFKTQSVIVSVSGRENGDGQGWTGNIDNFETTPILEGAEQPPFYPCLDTGSIRLEQVERFSGRGTEYFDVQYDGRYARFGFTKQDADRKSNPLDVFLNLRTCAQMAMAANGDRSGGVGRPETFIVALSRAKGPVGATSGQSFVYETDPNADPERRGAGAQAPVALNLANGAALIPQPTLSSERLAPLLSLADYFDPYRRDPNAPCRRRPPAPPPCGRSPPAMPGPRATRSPKSAR
jgi:hypothetical protein